MGGTEGDVVFSLPLTGFTAVNEIAELDNNRVLVVGQSTMPNVKGKKIESRCAGVSLWLNATDVSLPIFMPGIRAVIS